MTKQTDTAASAGYGKEQLLSSRKFAGSRDVLSALLEDGKTYTISEAEGLIDGFMKRKVV